MSHKATKEKTEVKNCISRARDAIEVGSGDVAVKELEKGLQIYPNNAKLLFELGYLYYEAGDSKKCEELLTRAAAQPSVPDCRVYFTLSEVSPLPRAAELASQGLEAGREQLARLDMELSALRAGATPRRTKLLQKCATLKRVVAQGCCKLAELEMARGTDGSSVRGLLVQAGAIDAAYLEPYYRLMLVDFNSGSMTAFDEAMETLLSKVAEFDDNDDDELEEYAVEFFNDVSRLLLEAGKFSQAARFTEIGASLHPGDHSALYLHAFACFRAGNLAEAAATVEELEALKILASDDAELVEGFCELRAELAKQAPPGGWADDDE